MHRPTLLLLVSSLALLLGSPAFAGIHTWDVAEVFSNADGTIQFVELVDAGTTGGEVNVGNASITSSLGTISWSNGAVAPPTNGRRYLIATPAFAALPGAPTPDVVVAPANVPIFNQAGDTVSFGAIDSMTFGAVPTNGTDSLDDTTGVGPNSPENYAGATASVNAGGTPPAVPLASPTALFFMLVLAGALGAMAIGRSADAAG
jgi:hypothetical protein